MTTTDLLLRLHRLDTYSHLLPIMQDGAAAELEKLLHRKAGG